MSLDNTVKLIQFNISTAEEHLGEILEARKILEVAGMYPAVPHFQWQRREELGEAKYLYLMFRQNQDGSYQGPDGRRKVYIGADPAKIEEAKRRTRNRENWERLVQEEVKLRRWITYTETQLEILKRDANKILVNSRDWPKSELSTQRQENAV